MFSLQVLQKVFSVEHRDERGGGGGDDDDGCPGTFGTKTKTINGKEMENGVQRRGGDVPFFWLGGGLACETKRQKRRVKATSRTTVSNGTGGTSKQAGVQTSKGATDLDVGLAAAPGSALSAPRLLPGSQRTNTLSK